MELFGTHFLYFCQELPISGMKLLLSHELYQHLPTTYTADTYKW